MACAHIPGITCPMCRPYGWPPYLPYPGHYPGHTTPIQATPRGCVCPAGAEKTCMGWDCPRKPLGTATSAVGEG